MHTVSVCNCKRRTKIAPAGGAGGARVPRGPRTDRTGVRRGRPLGSASCLWLCMCGVHGGVQAKLQQRRREGVKRAIKKSAPRDSRRAAGCGMAAHARPPAPASRRGARAPSPAVHRRRHSPRERTRVTTHDSNERLSRGTSGPRGTNTKNPPLRQASTRSDKSGGACGAHYSSSPVSTHTCSKRPVYFNH